MGNFLRAVLIVLLLSVAWGFYIKHHTTPEPETCGLWINLEHKQRQNAALRDTIRRLRTVEDISAKYGVSASLARPVVDAAERHGLDPYLFANLIRHESNWDPRAVGAVGELGLGQVRPSTARMFDPTLTEDELLQPGVAAEVSAWYLSTLVEKYDGNIRRALRAYNAGPTRIVTDHHVSHDYANRILEGM